MACPGTLGPRPTTMLPAPSPRADGAAGQSKGSAPTTRHPSPRLPAYPFTGVDGRLCREGGTQQQSIPQPADPTLSTAAPSWASVIRDGTSSGSSPTSPREEFFRLYKRCAASIIADLTIAIASADLVAGTAFAGMGPS